MRWPTKWGETYNPTEWLTNKPSFPPIKLSNDELDIAYDECKNKGEEDDWTAGEIVELIVCLAVGISLILCCCYCLYHKCFNSHRQNRDYETTRESSEGEVQLVDYIEEDPISRITNGIGD